MFCSVGELCFATRLQLCCAQTACTYPEARQQGLKAALDRDGDYYTPSALLAWGLHREQPSLWWDQGFSLCYLESRPAVPPLYNSHGSLWLVLALIGPNPSVIKTSILLRPRVSAFLMKSWFYNLFTCDIPTEVDMDEPALSSHFSSRAQSTAKYRKQIFTEEITHF